MENNEVSFSEPVVLFAVAICGLWFVGYALRGEFTFATPSIAATTSLLLLLGGFAFYSHIKNLSRSDRESKDIGNFISNQLEVVERRFLSNCHRVGLSYSASSPCDISKLRERTRSLASSQYRDAFDSEIDEEIEFKLGQLEALVSQTLDSCGIGTWIHDVKELCLELAEAIELRERLLVVHP